LTRPPADGRIVYQKHMTHHVTPDVGLDWILSVESCFLLRDPRGGRSYRVKRQRAAVAISASSSRRGSSTSSWHGRVGCRRSSTHATSCRTRDGRCPRSARRSGSTSGGDAVPGPRVVATPTASGRGTGTTRSNGPRASRRIARRPEPLDAAGRALADACRPFYEKLRASSQGDSRVGLSGPSPPGTAPLAAYGAGLNRKTTFVALPATIVAGDSAVTKPVASAAHRVVAGGQAGIA